MQPIKFHSIEDFLAFLPEPELKIVQELRNIIRECMPDAEEKLSYNVPYFYRHSRVVFIWPAAVPWGKVKLNGVMLGFCNGNLLKDELGWLDKGERKQVFTRTFNTFNEIDKDLVKMYLFDAIAVDDQLAGK